MHGGVSMYASVGVYVMCITTYTNVSQSEKIKVSREEGPQTA